MKPVAQLIDSPVDGDCFRACVASILEMRAEDLPNPHGPKYWLGEWNEWLVKYNMQIMYTANGQCYWTEMPYFIWSIQSPKYEGHTHAVVVNYDEKRPGMGSWQVAWDPSPYRDEPGRDKFYAKPLAAYFFVVRNPLRVLRFEQMDRAVRDKMREIRKAA